MASTLTRRPLPALVALLALLLLTGLVWWRVLNRGGSSSASSCRTPTPTPTTSAAAPPAGGVLPAPASVTISVLNSTNRNGLAAKARAALLAAGFKSPTAAAEDTAMVGKIAGVAQIRFGPAGATAAKVLSYYLPGATLVPNATKGAAVVVSLGAKYKAVATPAQAAAAMRAAHVQVSAPPPTPTPTPTASC